MIIFLLALIACTGSTVCGGESGGPAEFYVSPRGDDRNPGTEAEPFATLPRARNAVRAAIQAGLQKPATVMVRGGVYYLDETLVLDALDSGTREYPITYTAYPGEQPISVVVCV